jgi:hypothetical protein
MTKDVKLYLIGIRWEKATINKPHYDHETTQEGICHTDGGGLFVGVFSTRRLSNGRKQYEHQGIPRAWMNLRESDGG